MNGHTDALPETERRTSSYELHGETIEDPYLWLEGDDEDVLAWVDRQNEYADAHLRGEMYDALESRFETLADVADYGPVVVRGGRYFQRIEAPEQERAALTVRESIDEDPRTLVDPNEWDGTRSMDWFAPSNDGARVAYAVAEGGDEQYDVRVLDVESGETVDEIEDAGRAFLAWGEEGYYYLATGGADEGAQLEKEIRHRDPDGGERVLLELDDPHVWPIPHTDPDTGELVVAMSEMSGGTALRVLQDGELRPAIDGGDAEIAITLSDGLAYLRTDHGAPNGRVLRCPIGELRDAALDELTEVVPEREGVLSSIAVADESIVTNHMREATSRLAVYGRDGTVEGELSIPDHSTVSALTANPDADEAFYRVTSFDRPPTVVRRDLESGDARTVAAVDVDVPDLVVRREWFESADGTEVPVFVCHRKDLELDGDNPTVLYGYGGFRQIMSPGFDRFRVPFLEDGGVYAQVCARGGREFGEPWHEAGMFAEKVNTFDDFVGAAEHLIERGYTSAARLAVTGGSNGGLSVGAAITRRPDLFAAAVSTVPLLDMLRFHRFLLGESWTTEYGSPEDPDAFAYLREYSPYHNVEEDEYPAVLFVTAAGDTRVHPAHARKMAARMQAEADGGPFLLRTREETGHGVGKPTSMLVEERREEWTFLYDELGLAP